MTPIPKGTNYAKIRSFGDANSATTWDGEQVTRQEFIFDEVYGMIKCAPMTMHFIFDDPRSKGKKAIRGRWAYMCTCGSPAGIISYKDISNLISVEAAGYVLVCIEGLSNKHATGIFKHMDGSTE